MSIVTGAIELLVSVPEDRRAGPLWDFFRAHERAMGQFLVNAILSEPDPLVEYQFKPSQGVAAECGPVAASGEIKAVPSASPA